MNQRSNRRRTGSTDMEADKTTLSKRSGMGKALNIHFHQEEALRRIEEQDATVSYLMSPVRLAIFLHLCKNPCDHVRGISRAVKKSAHTTTWHLNKLCEVGYLDFDFAGRKRVFWPKGMLRKSDAGVVGLLRRSELLKVVGEVGKQEVISENELVSKLRVKQQNLNVWLKLLCASKVLKKTGRGRGTSYEISPGFIGLIKEYKSRSKETSASILRILTKDGLRPKKPSYRGSVFQVTISLPSGNRTLKLNPNPLANVSTLLK